jgi:hypothetical protein
MEKSRGLLSKPVLMATYLTSRSGAGSTHGPPAAIRNEAV